MIQLNHSFIFFGTLTNENGFHRALAKELSTKRNRSLG